MRQVLFCFAGIALSALVTRYTGKIAGLTFILGVGVGVIASAVFAWS
jgi:hypothetical protein